VPVPPVPVPVTMSVLLLVLLPVLVTLLVTVLPARSKGASSALPWRGSYVGVKTGFGMVVWVVLVLLALSVLVLAVLVDDNPVPVLVEHNLVEKRSIRVVGRIPWERVRLVRMVRILCILCILCTVYIYICVCMWSISRKENIRREKKEMEMKMVKIKVMIIKMMMPKKRRRKDTRSCDYIDIEYINTICMNYMDEWTIGIEYYHTWRRTSTATVLVLVHYTRNIFLLHYYFYCTTTVLQNHS